MGIGEAFCMESSDSKISIDMAADAPQTNTLPPTVVPETPRSEIVILEAWWRKWWHASLQTLPMYIALHIVFGLTSCFAVLFTQPDFTRKGVPLYMAWQSWFRWDATHFRTIATSGYDWPWRTAFFPFYPLCVKALMVLTHSSALRGELVVSNLACFVLFVVFYQLVCEDFDEERARRAMLYLWLFPTSFFLVAPYNESLFICFSLLCFYQLRHGNWWLAGLFGFFASLTRSTGLFLVLPFCYEYLRQRKFSFGSIRVDVVSMILVPAGIGVFALYCYYRFGDLLAFSHAQATWAHHLHGPWHGLIGSIKAIIISDGILSFQSQRNLLDLVPSLFILTMIILSMVGPWRLPRTHWSYCLYAGAVYIFLQLFPVGGTGLFPLQSQARYMLELFPAFILLATLGKYKLFNLYYPLIAASMLFFLLTQYLTGHWVL
ncbi:mannosyltransferase family protein [Dictyobacter kobayashii]|uniref:Glycosyltransferase RgtA/B/C/D-like domain-containing protein n=1 Tax=Dictyobacter kobayashii TaxID=2014872 RepID=A0A402AXW7_9CHLR|nr:mannosyltransferase family protein [Dictyobacter kobayashii]GCE23962.1 hypothetical protein KDK_77620 [Dictyobacter kobayashii]